jgi:hypothetical protein
MRNHSGNTSKEERAIFDPSTPVDYYYTTMVALSYIMINLTGLMKNFGEIYNAVDA